ncbi:AP2 domain-containing protein, partial [Listeria monocytogenes]|nr:AP2 domain-containing protein [Listeria monocytogenes]
RIEGEKYFQPLINKYNNRLDVFYSERRPFWT